MIGPATYYAVRDGKTRERRDDAIWKEILRNASSTYQQGNRKSEERVEFAYRKSTAEEIEPDSVAARSSLDFASLLANGTLELLIISVVSQPSSFIEHIPHCPCAKSTIAL